MRLLSTLLLWGVFASVHSVGVNPRLDRSLIEQHTPSNFYGIRISKAIHIDREPML
jgi:hypothetical protein